MKKQCSIFLLTASLLLTGCETASRPANSQTAEQSAEQSAETTQTEATAEAAEHDSDRDGMRGIFDWLTGRDESSLSEQRHPENSVYHPEYVHTTTDNAAFLKELSQTYTLTVDGTGLVSRSAGAFDDNLTWVIEVNGDIVLERGAEDEMTYRPMDYGNGQYRVWLKAWVNGYQIVSNTVEFHVPLVHNEPVTDEPEGFESWRIAEAKGHLKHLIRKIGDAEYKMGFVIDPDHDGYCNGIAYYAGKDAEGTEYQLIFDNSDNSLHFDSEEMTLRFGQPCTLGVWCNPHTEQDYIVVLTEDGSAYDACTLEKIEMSVKEAPECYLYIYSDSTSYDTDHFYVSYRGVTVWENA